MFKTEEEGARSGYIESPEIFPCVCKCLKLYYISQVYDEDGNDVTPAPLVPVEPLVGKGVSKSSVQGDHSVDGTQVGDVMGHVTFRG